MQVAFFKNLTILNCTALNTIELFIYFPYFLLTNGDRRWRFPNLVTICLYVRRNWFPVHKNTLYCAYPVASPLHMEFPGHSAPFVKSCLRYIRVHGLQKLPDSGRFEVVVRCPRYQTGPPGCRPYRHGMQKSALSRPTVDNLSGCKVKRGNHGV